MLTRHAQVRVVLICPGATDYALQHRVQGTLEVPLNAQGEQEAEQMASQLQPLGLQALYAAAGPAAQQTARKLAKSLDLRVRKLGKLNNLDWGLWQGMQIDEIRQMNPKVYRHFRRHPEQVCPPEGETLGQLEQKAAGVIRRILRRHRGEVIGIVAPEPLRSVIRHLLGDGNWGDLWQANCAHGTWVELEVDPEQVAQGGA